MTGTFVLYLSQSLQPFCEGVISQMATPKKRRPKPKGKTPPSFQRKKSRSFSEKAIMILGIIIALSMVLALVVNIGGGSAF
jgi:cell division protein FtsL